MAEGVARYGRYYRYYASVRPGLTGLWQVSGRNNVHYGRRVVFDVAYVRRRSVWLKLKLILATVPAVRRRKGSY